MERITQIYNNKYYVDVNKVQKDKNGYTGDAIEYLGKLENVYEEFKLRLEKIEAEMENYRNTGKQKTILFKELMGKKVVLKNVLDVFKEKCKTFKD